MNKTLLKYYLMIFFLIGVEAHAFQNLYSKHIKKADWNLKRGFTLRNTELRDSTWIYINEAKQTFFKYKEWEKLVNAIHYEAYIFNSFQDYDKAISLYDSAIFLAESKLPSTSPTIPRMYNKIGVILHNIGRYHKAKKYYLKGLSYLDQIGDHKQFAYIYANIANTFSALQDFNKTLEFFEKGKILMDRLNMKSIPEAQSLEFFGQIFYQKRDFENVRIMLDKSFQLHQQDKNIKGMMGCLNYLGKVAFRKNKSDEAIEIYKKGIEIGKNVKSNDKAAYTKVKLLIGIGLVYTELKEHRKAYDYFSKAYNYYPFKNHSWINLHLAKGYMAIEKYDSALYHFQKGIITLNKSFHKQDVFSNPKLGLSTNNPRFLDLLMNKAKVLYLKYQSDREANIEYLKAAHKTNLLSVDLSYNLLTDYTGITSKLEWSAFIKDVYNQTLITSLEMYETSGDKKYKEKAFELAAQSKSGILLSGIKSSEAINFAGIPNDILLKEKDLKVYISDFQTKLIRAQSKDKIDTAKINFFKERLFALNREQESLIALLEKDYPKYYQIKYNRTVLKVSEIQQFLRENKTFIQYFAGSEHIYAFIISQGSFEIKKLEDTEEITLLINQMKNGIQTNNFETYAEPAHQLYLSLLQPLEPLFESKELIIVPDGALWQLNFETLLKQKPEDNYYHQLEYLIKDYLISYVYSAEFLFDNQKTNKNLNNSCLAFSYNLNTENKTSELISLNEFRDISEVDLPGSKKEIQAVSKYIDGQFYFGKAATEAQFKKQAADYGILHLALHGIVDMKDPMQSGLKFIDQESNNSEEDGVLYAYELYNLELNADMVVLSACNSGAGKNYKGEGVMSVGRAFAYSGTKSQVISLWELADSFTPGIMNSFYKNLINKEEKNVALRNAKLKYLENANRFSANPLYWAPLVLIGDTSGLSHKNTIPGYLIIGLIGLLPLIVLMIIKRRK